MKQSRDSPACRGPLDVSCRPCVSPPHPTLFLAGRGRESTFQERMMRRFDLVLPTSLDDCVKILAERGGQAKLVAGGTDLLPQMKTGGARPALVVDLSGIARVRQIHSENGGGLRIGAAVTARELELHPALSGAYRALAESA